MQDVQVEQEEYGKSALEITAVVIVVPYVVDNQLGMKTWWGLVVRECDS